MSIIDHKTPRRLTSTSFRIIVMFSAWGFALVVTSCLFLWLGYLLDKALGTTPKFMFGLFFLSIIGCFIEIYKEVITVIDLANQDTRASEMKCAEEQRSNNTAAKRASEREPVRDHND